MSEQKLAIVTGANGMDAKTLTHQLLAKDYHVFLTHRVNDSTDVQKIEALFENDLKGHPRAKLSFTWLDLLSKNSIDAAIQYIARKYGRIDEFYSLAAISQVGTSFENFDLTMECNGYAQRNILESLRNHSKDTRFYFACTSEIFGGAPGAGPFNESSAPDCRSPYAISKNLGREITKFYRETYGMYACSGILFNHSNKDRKPYFFLRKVINAAVDIHLGKLNSLELGNINFYRDEHLSDFGCEMMHSMLNNPVGPKDYVIGNGKCYSGSEYLDAAFGYFGLDWHNFVKLNSPALMRPNEVVRLVADSKAAQRDLGWIPNRFGLKDIVDNITLHQLAVVGGFKPIHRNPLDAVRVKLS